MKGKVKRRQFSYNIVDFILCILAIAFVVITFWDFGSRLHYFAVIFGLGGLENMYIGARIWLLKHKVAGSIFLAAGIGLLVLCTILSINIWG